MMTLCYSDILSARRARAAVGYLNAPARRVRTGLVFLLLFGFCAN